MPRTDAVELVLISPQWTKPDDAKAALAPDLVGREFTAPAPSQRLVGDIT